MRSPLWGKYQRFSIGLEFGSSIPDPRRRVGRDDRGMPAGTILAVTAVPQCLPKSGTETAHFLTPRKLAVAIMIKCGEGGQTLTVCKKYAKNHYTHIFWLLVVFFAMLDNAWPSFITFRYMQNFMTPCHYLVLCVFTLLKIIGF